MRTRRWSDNAMLCVEPREPIKELPSGFVELTEGFINETGQFMAVS